MSLWGRKELGLEAKCVRVCVCESAGLSHSAVCCADLKTLPKLVFPLWKPSNQSLSLSLSLSLSGIVNGCAGKRDSCRRWLCFVAPSGIWARNHTMPCKSIRASAVCIDYCRLENVVCLAVAQYIYGSSYRCLPNISTSFYFIDLYHYSCSVFYHLIYVSILMNLIYLFTFIGF